MTIHQATQLIEEGAAALQLVERTPRSTGIDREHFDVIVIGGGQAGLSAGYHLARAGSRELEQSAANLSTDAVTAIAAHAVGSVRLAEGNPSAVLEPARHAFAIWQQMGAPYLAARLRVLLARACSGLGDVEGARLELTGASEVFERLGAQPDLAAVRSIEAGLRGGGTTAPAADHGLSERELQVLRLVATGKTNKAVARELALSEKTIDRHVSNIFAKLGVSARAAATAFAYEHKLI